MHLHPVDPHYPFAFFVHNCEAQSEFPKPTIHSTEKLPKLISDIVMKGLNTSTNYLNAPDKSLHVNNMMMRDSDRKSLLSMPIMDDKLNIPMMHNQSTMQSLDQIHLNNTIPLQGIEAIKVQMQQPVQQLTQVVVSAPQIDIPESLVMCQPTLMFDPTQVNPVTTHPLPHLFVHTHNIHAQHQGHYL